MTTLKDYKEKVLKEFEEKFDKNFGRKDYYEFYDAYDGNEWYGASMMKSAGCNDCGKCQNDREAHKEFLLNDLSLAIDNAVAEAFKAVEVERMDDTPTGGYTSSVITVSNAVGYNFALQEVEDRKKQYLV
jgi:hypothetical protein